MDPTKVDAVKTWPEPTSVKQLQSFFGFCNYCNRFIKYYSKIIASLTRLLQKEAKFNGANRNKWHLMNCNQH